MDILHETTQDAHQSTNCYYVVRYELYMGRNRSCKKSMDVKYEKRGKEEDR